MLRLSLSHLVTPNIDPFRPPEDRTLRPHHAELLDGLVSITQRNHSVHIALAVVVLRSI
jgi:hypothetical protein